MRRHLRKLLGSPFRLSDSTKDMRIARHPDHRPEGVDWTLQKYTADIRGPLVLDTSLGWTIRGRDLLTVANRSLLDQSADYPRPNGVKWLFNRKRYFAELIWLPFGSGNYFHFINDFMAGLALLPTGVPILVSEQLRNTSFFREMCFLSARLQGAEIITHREGEWIKTDRLLTALTWFSAAATIRDGLSLLDQMPPLKEGPKHNIIIARSGTRKLANLAELSAALPDFEVVYFEGLSVLRQREIINSARNIIALHGAGMTNLAFHEQPETVAVIEIRPRTHDNPCFSYLCTELGMSYHCVMDDGNYRVDVDVVAQVVSRLYGRQNGI